MSCRFPISLLYQYKPCTDIWQKKSADHLHSQIISGSIITHTFKTEHTNTFFETCLLRIVFQNHLIEFFFKIFPGSQPPEILFQLML